MRSVEEYYDCLDSKTLTVLFLKSMPKDEFLKKYKTDSLYNDLHNSKVGYIKVHKISDNPGIEKNKVYAGVTGAFGEGLAMWLSNPSEWFHTSTIKKIDWDKKVFETMNSVYAFEFEEMEYKDLVRKLLDLEIDSYTDRIVKNL